MVRVDVDDDVHRITFDRPEVQNAFTATAADELRAALDAASDTGVRAVVLTGDGDAFSAGGDIDAMAERDETPHEAETRMREANNALTKRILEAPFPVVARVNGDAVGMGTTLAAAADFTFAAERARFGAVFVNVGLIPDSGATLLLRELVGLRRAKELAMTGRLFDATEAAEMDLINEAVPEDALDDRVDDCLRTLTSKPSETLGLTKRALHENLGRPYADALDREASIQALAYGTDAHERGVEAFRRGETPEFD